MVKSYPFVASTAPPSGKPEKTSHSADRQFVHVCTMSDKLGGGLSWGLPWFTMVYHPQNGDLKPWG